MSVTGPILNLNDLSRDSCMNLHSSKQSHLYDLSNYRNTYSIIIFKM